MSRLPGVIINLQDNALGIVPAGSDQIEVVLGVCSAGVVGQLSSLADLTTLKSTIGVGPAAEAAACALAASGSNCLVLPVNPSIRGGASAVSHTGSDTGTISVAAGPRDVITIRITTDGYAGAAAKFTTQVGSDAQSAAISMPASTYLVPGTLSVITFGAGEYTNGDVFVLNLDATITHTGSGETITAAHSPLDNYQVEVDITSDGYGDTVDGTPLMKFQISLDAGNNLSPETKAPSSGVYVVSGAGLVLTFDSHFTEGEQYTFETITATYSTTDLTDALDLLTTTYRSRGFSLLHVVNNSASAADALLIASALDLACLELFNQGKYVVGISECPTVGSIIPNGVGSAAIDTADDDDALILAFEDFVSAFVGVGAGDCDLTSALTGRIDRRNAASPLLGRLTMIAPGTDAAKVKSGLGLAGGGALPSVVAVYRNENATPALNDARFCTLRTFDGLQGFYITGAHTMATSTSDYLRLANRRVINEACTITRTAALLYVESDLRLDPVSGKILEVVAQQIESDINGKLSAAMINKSPPDASAVRVVVDRNSNLLQTQTLQLTVRVLPKGYSSYIDVNIGFALSLA